VTRVLDSKDFLMASLLLEFDTSSWHCMWLRGSRNRFWRQSGFRTSRSWSPCWTASYSQGRGRLLLSMQDNATNSYCVGPKASDSGRFILP